MSADLKSERRRVVAVVTLASIVATLSAIGVAVQYEMHRQRRHSIGLNAEAVSVAANRAAARFCLDHASRPSLDDQLDCCPSPRQLAEAGLLTPEVARVSAACSWDCDQGVTLVICQAPLE